jgi:hypothetical protein
MRSVREFTIAPEDPFLRTGESMPIPFAIDELVQTQITSDEALKIARLDTEKAYRDLTPYRVLVELVDDNWHVDYELTNREAQGGGAHYLIDAQSGKIRSKRYEQ